MKKGFKQFLSDEMARMNKLDDPELFSNMKEKFRRVMKGIRETLGEQAFAKFRKDDQEWVRMSTFNAAVFDALSVAVGDSINTSNPLAKNGLCDSFRELFSDPEFFRAVEGSVNDQTKIETRIAKVKGLLQ